MNAAGKAAVRNKHGGGALPRCPLCEGVVGPAKKVKREGGKNGPERLRFAAARGGVQQR